MSDGRSEAMMTYFTAAAEFFFEYKWIYNFKATEVLSETVMQGISKEFQNFFKSLDASDEGFHKLLNLIDNECWPTELRKFVFACTKLKNTSAELTKHALLEDVSSLRETTGTGPSVNPQLPIRLPKKWNPKKYFEVAHISNFVGELCVIEQCDTVVDIGSGLGYLSDHIASQFKIPVIGIESEASRVKTAENNYLTKSGNPTSKVSQTFVCLRITQNISEELNPIVKNSKRTCLTALHACGDLTPWALKYFVSNANCKIVAVIPCCYHKMDVNGSNFPMSVSLLSKLSHYADITFLKNSWLWRLACQRSGVKFLEDIKKETSNLFFRAVLEKYIMDGNLRLVKRRRHLNDGKYNDFQEYLNKTIANDYSSFEIFKGEEKVNGSSLSNTIQELAALHDELSEWSRIITGILALQGAMQSIAEDIILLDRLQFMEESNLVKSAGLIRVIPENVSPRGMVLCGIKE